MKNIFERGLRLFDGIIYKPVKRYSTFFHIKSVFNDEWYNFISPTIEANLLDWDNAKSIISSEKANGVSMSYYISEKLVSSYKKYFSEAGKNNCIGSDYYICKHIDNKSTPIGELVLVDDQTIEVLINMAKICFPEWNNNEEYARQLYKNQKISNHKIARNYLFKYDNNLVGFCGLIGSESDNLSYFHNIGVLPEFRRNGYFTAMIKHLINISLEYDITDTYALVENGSGSYHGLTKLGYKVDDKYHLFST
jgi:N-acetylglutamate synthase-like GNAT family acetyltransferase